MNPLTPTVAIWAQYSCEGSCARPGWTERQSARMSKITNDGLTRSGTGCFIAVPIWQQWASKGHSKQSTISCTIPVHDWSLCQI